MLEMVDKSVIDDWMRKCALRFLEGVSFSEVYLRETNNYQENKKYIDKNNKLIGLLRVISKNHANDRKIKL